ncbi:hypothetical protein Pint_21906 [Pistacia integerrima]|uniref:Uncharacterized protein n=1 Tax=Pistacia integerrima TaxID=434235 RepID=A0ACC0XER6_9ROSI|nr:hypothetical protein Pint_21906 [Pistacia integerrima]
MSSLSTLLSVQPHQDGPAYFSEDRPAYFSVVAILSLGSPVLMGFTHSKFRLSTSVLKNTVDDNNSNGKDNTCPENLTTLFGLQITCMVLKMTMYKNMVG